MLSDLQEAVPETVLNEPRATIAASEPSYRACFVEGADLFLGEPDFDRIKLCHCGSSSLGTA